MVQQRTLYCKYVYWLKFFKTEAQSRILCKLRKRRVKQREKLYFREVVYRLLDCIVAKSGTVVKGSEAVYLNP